MDDYYALLGVERTAPASELEKEIRKQLRTWSKRSNHPDLSRRQEAERRVQQLSEARKILLDEQKRAEYDRALAAAPAPREAVPDKSTDLSWIDEARRRVAAGDFLSAAYAAREARDADPNDPEAWGILAWVNAETGNLRDALYEATRAVELEPGEASRHLDLGDIQARMRMADAAIASYRRAQELDPGLEEATVGIALTLQDTGRHAEALEMLEQLLPRSGDPQWLGDQLAMALITAAEAMPRVRTPTGILVTSPAEVEYMRRHMLRARMVTQDPDLLATIDEMERMLQWCADRHWQTPAWMGNGCLIAAGVVGLIVAGIISLGVLGSGVLEDILAMLVFWVIGLAVIVPIIYFSAFVPGWRINQMAYFRQTVYGRPW